MERRTIDRPVEIRADGDARVITGLAAVFYDPSNPDTEYQLWEDSVERILPGAFDSVREDDVRALFNHNNSLLLGRTKSGTLRLDVTSRGLEYEIDIADTSIGRDVAEHIRRGDVTGSSFGFVVVDEEWVKQDGKQVRNIKRVKTIDVSPVTFPAYTATEAQVRDDAKRSYETWQHDVSQRQKDAIAKRIRARLVELKLT